MAFCLMKFSNSSLSKAVRETRVHKMYVKKKDLLTQYILYTVACNTVNYMEIEKYLSTILVCSKEFY